MLLYFNSASNQFSKQLTVILLLFQLQFLIDWKVLMSCRQNSEEEKPYDVYRFSHRRSGYSRPKSSLFLLWTEDSFLSMIATSWNHWCWFSYRKCFNKLFIVLSSPKVYKEVDPLKTFNNIQLPPETYT